MNSPLHDFIIEEHIKNALKEDIGFGDITTDYLTSEEDKLSAKLVTREDGVLCGANVFAKVFQTLDQNMLIKFFYKDGDFIKKGNIIAELSGSARCLLNGERVALNYIQRMSGVATETRKYVEKIKNYPAHIADTRKTTPNFRIFEKYAVKIGGATLHRFNLSDCVMIKDNHIKFAGSITKAVSILRENISHTHKIEVECDTFEQVKEALECKADIIMFDNMNPSDMRGACNYINGRAIIEASGNVTLDTLQDIAASGVDIISTSAIVAKAKTLDLGLDIE